MELTIIDNAISKGYQNLIKGTFSTPSVDWYFNENTTYTSDEKPSSTGFSHTIFDNDQPLGPFFHLVYPVVLESLEKYKQDTELKKLFRIRAAMFIKDQSKELYNAPHRDHNFPHYTMLYYIIDSDGPTRIFDNKTEKVIKEIEPKQGRVVFFPGDTLHASASPREYSRRMVINYNFLIQGEKNESSK